MESAQKYEDFGIRQKPGVLMKIPNIFQSDVSRGRARRGAAGRDGTGRDGTGRAAVVLGGERR